MALRRVERAREIHRLGQVPAAGAEGVQVSLGLNGEESHAFPGRLDPQQGHVVGFSPRRVLAPGRLAHGVAVALGVQNVIDDLIGETDIAAESGQGGALGVRGFDHRQGQLKGAGDKRAGLHSLHPRNSTQIIAHAQQIDHLAARHPLGAGGHRQPSDQLGAHGPIRVGVGMGEDFKGGGLQGVAGQDGGGLVVGLVHRGPAAAHVVVVHAGQVVVNQAVGVDQLQGAGGAQHRTLRQVEEAPRLQSEKGPQTFAGAQRRVAHGLGEPRLGAVGPRQQFVQRHGDQVGGLRNSAAQRDGVLVHEKLAGSRPSAPAGPTTIFSTLSWASLSLLSQWALRAAPRS